jgi:hypothetical protein
VIYDGDRCLGGAVIETVLSGSAEQIAQPAETTPRNCLGQFRDDGKFAGDRRSAVR